MKTMGYPDKSVASITEQIAVLVRNFYASVIETIHNYKHS